MGRGALGRLLDSLRGVRDATLGTIQTVIVLEMGASWNSNLHRGGGETGVQGRRQGGAKQAPRWSNGRSSQQIQVTRRSDRDKDDKIRRDSPRDIAWHHAMGLRADRAHPGKQDHNVLIVYNFIVLRFPYIHLDAACESRSYLALALKAIQIPHLRMTFTKKQQS